MKAHRFGALELRILDHVRVDFGDRVGDYFKYEASYLGERALFNPGPGQKRVEALDYGFVGPKRIELADGTVKRGGDFRRRLIPRLARRAAKAIIASRIGKTIGQLTDADVALAPADLQAFYSEAFDYPTFLHLNHDGAVREILGEDRPIRFGPKPNGTTVDIDVSYDSYVAINPGFDTENSTGTLVSPLTFSGSADQYGLLKFITQGVIEGGAAINDTDMQMNIVSETNEIGELGGIWNYGPEGSEDPAFPTTPEAKIAIAQAGSKIVDITGSDTTGSKSVDLGSTGDSYVTNGLRRGFISFVLYTGTGMDSLGDGYDVEALENAGTDPVTLTVDYTAPTPASVGPGVVVGAANHYIGEAWVGAPPVTAVTVTKDVTTSAAVSTTNTKDVTTSACISRTETKDVTTSAAISTTGTANVTSTACLTTTNTSDVSTSAAISTTNVASVTTAAVLSTTATSDVSSDACIEVAATVTADVSTSACLTTTNVANVTSSACLTTTNTADVTSSAALATTATSDVTTAACLSTTNTASVTTTAATSRTEAADVTSTSAISTTATSDVTTTGALSTTNTADLTSSAAVSRTATVDLGTAAALSLVALLNVATAAALGAVVSRDVTTEASIATSLVTPTAARLVVFSETATRSVRYEPRQDAEVTPSLTATRVVRYEPARIATVVEDAAVSRETKI